MKYEIQNMKYSVSNVMRRSPISAANDYPTTDVVFVGGGADIEGGDKCPITFGRG